MREIEKRICLCLAIAEYMVEQKTYFPLDLTHTVVKHSMVIRIAIEMFRFFFHFRHFLHLYSLEPWISRDSKMEAHYKWYTNLRTQYPHLKVRLNNPCFKPFLSKKSENNHFFIKMTKFSISNWNYN